MRRATGTATVVAIALAASGAAAQPSQIQAFGGASAHDAEAASSPGPNGNLRAHFGVDVADRLLHSAEADDRVRGVQRAAAIGSPEAVALLVRAAEPNGAARSDARVAIELARALAAAPDDAKTRTALESLVTLQGQSQSARAAAAAPPNLDADFAARLAVARAIAALALARTQDPHVVEWLLGAVRSAGVGQAPAAAALLAYPPAAPGAFHAQNVASPAVLRLIAALGDLRALDIVRAAAKSTDVEIHAAAIETLGAMGDMRDLPLATAAAKEHDARARVAGVTALVALGVPEAAAAVEKLMGDEATAIPAMRLAERLSSPGIVRALSARALASADAAIRSAAVAALGRSADPSATRALLEVGKRAGLQADVAAALARSPGADAMAAIASLAEAPATRRLGARAYLTRALVRGERSGRGDAVLALLATSRDGADQALGIGAQIALGDRELEPSLAAADPRVRRAAAMASLARGPGARASSLLLARLATENDEATRAALAIGLLGGDPEGRVPTLALVDRAESRGPDAPLSAMVLARRADDALKDKVDALLAAPDPILRAHVARGLGASRAKDAVGRLAAAYAYEPEASVRRAIVLALAARDGEDASAPERLSTMATAARLDPDDGIRVVASRALAFAPAAPAPVSPEVAWLRLVSPDGRPPAAAGLRDATGALLRADGLAVPCVFDDDGFALLPGTPPGDAELVLAPRLPAYEGVSR